MIRRINDPAIDLAIISAILSSNMDIAIDSQTCLAGEIGLSGEIRPINRIEQRISEAEKLGFKRALIPPKRNAKKTDMAIRTSEIGHLRTLIDTFRE